MLHVSWQLKPPENHYQKIGVLFGRALATSRFCSTIQRRIIYFLLIRRLQSQAFHFRPQAKFQPLRRTFVCNDDDDDDWRHVMIKDLVVVCGRRTRADRRDAWQLCLWASGPHTVWVTPQLSDRLSRLLAAHQRVKGTLDFIEML